MTVHALPPVESRAADAERSVIGGVLIDNDALDGLKLRSTDFGDMKLAKCWEGALALRQDGEPVDRVTLKGWLAGRGARAGAVGRFVHRRASVFRT